MLYTADHFSLLPLGPLIVFPQLSQVHITSCNLVLFTHRQSCASQHWAATAEEIVQH